MKTKNRKMRMNSKATNKGHIHQVNPTYKAPKAKMSPADWGRMMRRLKKVATAGRK